MKRIISLLVGCSLALAGAALAQEPAEQQPPSKGKRAPEKTHAPEAQPRAKAGKPQERPANQTGAVKERGATNERSAATERGARNRPDAETSKKTHADRQTTNAPETDASGEATNKQRAEQNRKAQARDESAKNLKPGEKPQAEQQKGAKGSATTAKTAASPPAAAGTNAAPPASVGGHQNTQVNAGAKGKKPAPQQVQQVKSQHANFRAQPKPQQVPAVTFNQNHRIEGSDHWQGQQYQVFRSYRPEWHDASWYRSRYSRVELIGGGYYFFNNGYWFPAWGYEPSAQYYAYDGPIYVGQRAVPPDQVIADTQALLKQMGYYTGEVDGLLGPLTRQALSAYQADQGLATTQSIDQPTLDSLGLA